MMEQENKKASAQSALKERTGSNSEFHMAPELMIDLARKAAELLVERIEGLPEQDAWEGEFKQELDDRLMGDPPEDGRPPVEVLEQAARDVLPIAMRLDHSSCFALIPTSPIWPGILAEFMSAGYNANLAHCEWAESTGVGSH